MLAASCCPCYDSSGMLWPSLSSVMCSWVQCGHGTMVWQQLLVRSQLTLFGMAVDKVDQHRPMMLLFGMAVKQMHVLYTSLHVYCKCALYFMPCQDICSCGFWGVIWALVTVLVSCQLHICLTLTEMQLSGNECFRKT
jgi:hypothetical protein